MGKSTPKFVNGIIVFVLVLASCSGKEMPEPKKEETKKEKVFEVPVEVEAITGDTIWTPREETKNTIPNWSLDTHYIHNNERINLVLKIRPVSEPFEYTNIERLKDSVLAQKLIGPQFELSVKASSSSGRKVMSAEFTKDDLITKDNVFFLAADSYSKFQFIGFFPEFDAILLRSIMGYPNSDDCIAEFIFVGLDGKVKKQITNGHAYDICDCDPISSPDGKTFSFCKGILHSDYRLVPIERDTPLAGIFQLGNKFSLAVYMFEGKPPYSNMKLLNRYGAVVKSFSFEGIGGDMSYEVDHYRIDNDQRLLLVDDAKRQLLVFDIDDPYQPEIINFRDTRSASEAVEYEGERFHFSSLHGEIDVFYLDGEFLVVE